MVLYFKITVDDSKVQSMMRKFQSPMVLEEVTNANYKTGQLLAERMRNLWIGSSGAGPARAKHAGKFRAIKRRGTYTVDVMVPMQAYWMDVLQRPRYFSIAGKLRMKRWINANFGSMVQTGKSRVHFGKDRRAKYGRLYVYPDHFSRRALMEIRKEHKHYLGKVVKNVIKGGI